MTEEKKSIWKAWLKCAGVRAAKTAAQIGVVLIGSDMVSITSLDWPYIVGCMAAGAVLSLLTSVAGIPEAASPWAEAKVDGQHGREA